MLKRKLDLQQLFFKIYYKEIYQKTTFGCPKLKKKKKQQFSQFIYTSQVGVDIENPIKKQTEIKVYKLLLLL